MSCPIPRLIRAINARIGIWNRKWGGDESSDAQQTKKPQTPDEQVRRLMALPNRDRL